MPTLRSVHAVALAAVLAACGDRAASTPAPSPPAAAGAADKLPDGAQPGAPGPAPTAAALAASATAPSQAAAAGAPAAPVAPAAAAPTAAGTQAAPAAGAAPAGGAPAPAPATGPSPVSTVFKQATAVEPGGGVIPLAQDGDTVVDPSARFEVVLSVASPDARLVLLDPKDALVAAAEAHEVGQSTRLTLAPSAPLAPGRRYTLRVDGASTRELHDGAGKAFTPSTLTVRVAGTAQPEPKESQATRRRHRR